MPGARDDHSAVFFKFSMLIFGGFTDIHAKTNAVHCFEFQKSRWTLVHEGTRHGLAIEGCPSARSGHSASVWKSKMIVFGGIDVNLNRLNDTWIFNLTTYEWTLLNIKISDFYKPSPRSGHSAALYGESYLIIFGGMTAVTKELDDVVALDLYTN